MLSEKEELLLDLCEKDINTPEIDNLYNFWNDKIMKNISQFKDFENINKLINDIDQKIKKLKTKEEKQKENILELEEDLLEEKNELNLKGENNILSLRSSMPLNSYKRSSLVENPSERSPKKILDSEDEEENEIEKEDYDFLKNLHSNNIECKDKINIENNKDDENKNEGKVFLRLSSKKSATVGANILTTNNLEIKFFNYQEEQKDNNFITKIKSSKTFLNFIDIDLFLQYIALGKTFYETEEENKNLREGFCLQYQAFIFPETLINKIISCFNYFYSLYLNKDEEEIIEEKSEDEEEKNITKDLNDDEFDEDENSYERKNIFHRRNAFRMRKRTNSSNFDEYLRKIPFGLIDFLYTFINLHNTYFHNDLSHEVISKINEFIKKLLDINEIKEKYEQVLELSEIELKEYEASIKKFEPIEYKNINEDKIDNLSSSDELSFDAGKEIKEEKNDKKEEIEKKDEKDEKKDDSVNKKESEEEINEKKVDNNKEKEKKVKFKEEKKIDNEKKEEKIDNLKKEENNNIEEKEEYQDFIKKTVTYNPNKTFKLSSTKVVNPIKFINIYLEGNQNKNIKEDGKNEKKKNTKSKNENKKEKDEKEKPYEFDILKYKSLDIALELARVNYALFSKIKIKEFLKGAFNGKDKYKKSPYICQIIRRFNTISCWVTEEILAYDHAFLRAKILLKFIRICGVLKKIGDFDDCLSILTGLTCYNISKLHKTWGHISSDEMTNFRALTKLLSFEKNWKNLRIEIDKKIEENSFFIPYLGFYTKRMMYLEEMGPYIKKNTSLINIEKIVEVYKVLKDFYKLLNVKKPKYNCLDENVKKELIVLQCLEPSNEDFLIQTSNLLEPKFILSNKKLKIKRRTKTDINFLNNINKINII